MEGDGSQRALFLERMSQVANTDQSEFPTDEKTDPKRICRGCLNYPPCPIAVPLLWAKSEQYHIQLLVDIMKFIWYDKGRAGAVIISSAARAGNIDLCIVF